MNVKEDSKNKEASRKNLAGGEVPISFIFVLSTTVSKKQIVLRDTLVC